MRTGEDLRALREALGLTQKELAERLGVARNYVYLVETGKKAMSKKLDLAIDKAFPASVSVVGNSAPVAVGSPGACFGGGVSPPGEETLGARVAALEARVSALERALVAALGKGRGD